MKVGGVFPVKYIKCQYIYISAVGENGQLLKIKFSAGLDVIRKSSRVMRLFIIYFTNVINCDKLHALPLHSC